MSYLLDTNVCINLLRGCHKSVLQKLKTMPEKEILLCAIVKAELLVGATKLQSARQLEQLKLFFNRFDSIPFDDSAAKAYAKIRSNLERKGTPIGGNDLFIAAIAITNNLILVTHNTREFSRVQGVKFEDWEA